LFGKEGDLAMRTIVLLTLSALWSMSPALRADEHEGIAFPRVGKLTPRHAKEIRGSNWSVGAETMDRDFTVYRHWRDYLGPLGIKKARLQAGWARTEQEKGVYDFAWLDEAVFDMPKHGVTPWMCLSYGNPIYEGGGQARLMGGVPTSDEALEAWIKWVKANVERYREGDRRMGGVERAELPGSRRGLRPAARADRRGRPRHPAQGHDHRHVARQRRRLQVR
jgi:hypothetical protein